MNDAFPNDDSDNDCDDFDDNDDKNNMNMSILTMMIMMITDSVILDDCRKVSQRVSFPSSPDTWNADS